MYVCIIVIIFITFVQGIYNSVHETRPVSRVQSVAAILYLQFMEHAMSFPMLNVLCLYISI